MSFFETQMIGIAGSLAGNFLAIKPQRSFASFSDFCSISESHSASVELTDYPIEAGMAGTDHIIRNPDEISWEIGFEESNDPRATYNRLYELMVSGTPFDATTGLRDYQNMVITSISVTQTSHTGRILRCQLTLREIRITSPLQTILPERAKQASPNITGSTANTGAKNLSDPGPEPKSQLAQMLGG